MKPKEIQMEPVITRLPDNFRWPTQRDATSHPDNGNGGGGVRSIAMRGCAAEPVPDEPEPASGACRLSNCPDVFSIGLDLEWTLTSSSGQINIGSDAIKSNR